MAKLIKDVVHGYVDFEEEFIDIINSSAFQRLRNIRQTSYISLYPSSLHDRFTHSIGVYALGKYAFEHFEENVKADFSIESKDIDWKNKKDIFLKACLLHDIGHAPFSHTGENFYLQKRTNYSPLPIPSIYVDLISCVKNDIFEKDFNNSQLVEDKLAKPHEIMSAIVGIKKFDKFINESYRDLFARMIIGLRYENRNDEKCFEQAIDNSLIQLLNSSVIDVDRLDYLARDRTMTGFESVKIDTERLLANVCLVNMNNVGINKQYTLGYYKNAASVIENVVVAHDSEKKWIQSNAVVLYDSFLVQKCIKGVEKFLSSENNFLFCEDTLGDEGVKIDGRTIRLLCDADIIHLAKQIPSNDYYYGFIEEYFSRSNRKKAIWKTESEFRLMLREIGENERTNFLYWIKELINNLAYNGTSSDEDNIVINQRAEEIIIEECDKKIKNIGNKESATAQKYRDAVLKQFNVFKEFAQANNIEYNFVITFVAPFSSNIDKLTSNDVLIKYKNFGYAKPVGEIIKTYSADEHTRDNQENEKIFFIYYKRNTSTKYISPVNFIKYFCNKIENEFVSPC